MSNKENIVLEKSFEFAKDVIAVYLKLKSGKEFDIARQFLKSGTSIGANIEEAQGAQSKKDFISKISIAYKEARECNYWIRLLDATGIWEGDTKLILAKSNELLRILTSILNSSKKENS